MADTITQMADMIDPEILAPMVHYSLEKVLRFTPIAKTDDSLKGKPGDTLSMPKFTYIGDAQDIGEGQPIPLDKLGTKSVSVKVKKAAKGTQITDEALLSGEGEPLKELTRQLGLATANKIDDDLLTEAKKGKQKVTFAPTVSGVQDGLDVFSNEDDKQVVLVVSPATAAKIRMDAVKNHAGSDTIANALIKGTYFDVLGVQIIRSKKLKDTEALFIKADNVSPALKLIRKRDIQVETDRDITKKITIMTADQHYAAYLYDDTKIVAGTVQSETTVRRILGFEDPREDDMLIANIIEVIEARLKSKLGSLDEVPVELQYIIVEASIARFNRVNDEGKKTASESDVSATYETNDLAPFESDIQEWLTRNDSGKRRFMMY